MTKTCTKCGNTKPIEAFSKRASAKDGYAYQCNACKKVYYDAYYASDPREKGRLTKQRVARQTEVRAYIQEAKNVPCMDCGQRYPYYVMDFDHQRDKSFNIGSGMSGKTLTQIKAEIEKCEIVCSNCHRERTYDRANRVR